MAALSIRVDGHFVICATPIFLTSEPSADLLTFEVFESDAARLKSVLGKAETYYLDDAVFFAELITLERCQSTHPGLALLRHKPTMRGVLRVHKSASPTVQ